MPTCTACGAFVSHDFARVFGNNTETVGACLKCAPIGEYTDPDRGEPAHHIPVPNSG